MKKVLLVLVVILLLLGGSYGFFMYGPLRIPEQTVLGENTEAAATPSLMDMPMQTVETVKVTVTDQINSTTALFQTTIESAMETVGGYTAKVTALKQSVPTSF